MEKSKPNYYIFSAAIEKFEREVGPTDWTSIESEIRKMIEARTTSQRSEGMK